MLCRCGGCFGTDYSVSVVLIVSVLNIVSMLCCCRGYFGTDYGVSVVMLLSLV